MNLVDIKDTSSAQIMHHKFKSQLLEPVPSPQPSEGHQTYPRSFLFPSTTIRTHPIHTSVNPMHSLSVRGSSTACDECGQSNKKLLENEFVCMTCGIVDTNVMIVDERSEQKKQWESSESDGHASKYPVASNTIFQNTIHAASKVPGLRSTAHALPADTAYKKATTIAQKTSHVFSVETDQIPLEAASMYMAVREATTGKVCVVEVIACTMVAARRRTAQDIEDVALAFSMKPKTIASAIESVEDSVLMGDKAVGDAYGYLFTPDEDRGPCALIKEAVAHLLETTLDKDLRLKLIASSWGIRLLAEDMITHVLKCRLTGGESLQLLARAMVVKSCELHLFRITAGDYISNCVMCNHCATWDVALAKWPGGQTAFDSLVAHKRQLREYGTMINKKRPRPLTEISRHGSSAGLVSSKTLRLRIRGVFATPGRFRAFSGTSVAAGVTHLCITCASNSGVRAYLDGEEEGKLDRVMSLMDVCMADVRCTAYPAGMDSSIITMIKETVGYARVVVTARGFKTLLLPELGCFIPRELMKWGK